ncbi:hypothetical protein SAMN02983003_2586 [Devosia enhydra]|uniref:Uncharacterized protein n=1 Tax=Devosia enhydra TaxID=665118 RepID=A0A1K2HZ56_9HYPH|nr:hypothetical protein [Devosia enhydra]SFZ85422.1 hypothetical protein SAMN02983003_2586 [Devosia enhydra]
MPDLKTKDRSPSFPFIPIAQALERLTALEATFSRHPIPASKAGIAWGMKEKSSQAYQILAALKAFGLVQYEGSAEDRKATLTDAARTYLRAQQEAVKLAVVQRAALAPKIIGELWKEWGAKRPPDAVCLDELILKRGFTDSAARTFLKVYDETIEYALLIDGGMVEGSDADDPIDAAAAPDQTYEDQDGAASIDRGGAPIPPKKVGILMSGERELTAGLLSRNASYRVIVNGRVGTKEIETLIKKLEIDKEILADEETNEGVDKSAFD